MSTSDLSMQSINPTRDDKQEPGEGLSNGGAAASATPLQKDVLKVLSYFDIFHHPLTPEEIYSFLPSNSTSVEKVFQACHTAPLHRLVNHAEGYFSLSADVDTSVSERREKAARARQYWRIAYSMSKIIRRFPFVRSVLVSGELSKGVASRDGDIDYVIITKAKRLWICRTLLILFKKIVLLNNKKFFCLNLFVAEDHLVAETQNLYSATEIATLMPLYNRALFERYLQANAWINDFFPNWEKSRSHSPPEQLKPSFIRRVFELPFDNRWGEMLDAWLMKRWRQLWKKRYPELDDERRDRLFQCRMYISTAYGEDFLYNVLREYNKRVEGFSIEY